MSALRWTSAEIVVAKPGRFSSKLTWLALPGGIRASRYTEGLPRVLRSYHAPGRALIGFTTALGPTVFAGASELPLNSIFRFGEADSSFQRSTGRVEFATVSMPLEDVEAFETSFTSDFRPPRDSVIVTPNAAAMARLQKIHAAAGELAEQTPNVIAVPEAAHGLAQALLAAMADCLAAQHGDHRETGSQHRKAIMNRFHRMLEAHPDGVLHVLEICKAIRVSRRTLTTCCNETLGMSPHRYLKLRQLHLVHRALRQADPLVATVTTVATEHGFWDLGRFASAYRGLFGERPSETLQQGAGEAPSEWDQEYFMRASQIT